MCFYLKWCVKIKIQQKSTKSQSKKTLYETVNFGSTEWYNILKKYLYNFVIFYFTCNKLIFSRRCLKKLIFQ